jgi:hypothetical protein
VKRPERLGDRQVKRAMRQAQNGDKRCQKQKLRNKSGLGEHVPYHRQSRAAAEKHRLP